MSGGAQPCAGRGRQGDDGEPNSGLGDHGGDLRIHIQQAPDNERACEENSGERRKNRGREPCPWYSRRSPSPEIRHEQTDRGHERQEILGSLRLG